MTEIRWDPPLVRGGANLAKTVTSRPTKTIRPSRGGDPIRPFKMTEILNLLLLCVLLCETLLAQKTFYIATHNWTKRYSKK